MTINASKPNNTYWIVRHGQSEANLEGIIAGASPVNRDHNCLTKSGMDEVRNNFARALREHATEMPWELYASPLCRTRQTAEVISQLLHVPATTDERLLERDFGRYEGTSTSNYKAIWEKDSKKISVGADGVEEIKEVFDRVTNLITEMEHSFTGTNIVLCTHGDVASILIAMLTGSPLTQHRQIGALATGAVYVFPN
jgi:broad specificity phosphatase PhoE